MLKNAGALLRLARLHFLIPGFMLYLMGYLLALNRGAGFRLETFVFGYFVFGTAQLSVSFSNDYFDRHSDKNSIKTVFSGGSKVLIEHPELEQLALRIAVVLLGLSIMGSAIFTIVYAYPFWLFIFGLFGGLIGWFYTAPPLKFSYRELGELATVLAIGFFIPGMGYFVASRSLDSPFYVFIFPLICYGLFFILTVEIPDVESDTIAQKRNIVVNWGTEIGKRVCILANILGTISLVTISLTEVTGKNFDPTSMAIFSVIPLIASIAGINTRTNNISRQVALNIASLIIFLFLVDMDLLLQ
jgi:1,4-dihydroxy-2-naphthoate octaprenyltransferase